MTDSIEQLKSLTAEVEQLAARGDWDRAWRKGIELRKYASWLVDDVRGLRAMKTNSITSTTD